jgi:hypothetical protein
VVITSGNQVSFVTPQANPKNTDRFRSVFTLDTEKAREPKDSSTGSAIGAGELRRK